MIDITVLGSGNTARTCSEMLAKAGFAVQHAFELEDGDRSPIILGDLQGAFQLARKAVEDGRHLLISNPLSFAPERLSLLLEARKKSQALFVWNERRYHPGYRFAHGLMEADASWRPRYLRQETLSLEATSGATMRWRTLEALALTMSFADGAPVNATAASADNSLRGAPDVISAQLDFGGMKALIQVALGEAVERRETLIAAADRKAYIDEFNPSTPVRIVEDEPRRDAAGAARWLSCSPPGPEELARQQCLTFLDATLKTELASAEASLWLRSLGALEAVERSLSSSGASVEVEVKEEAPRFRLVVGQKLTPTPHTAA